MKKVIKTSITPATVRYPERIKAQGVRGTKIYFPMDRELSLAVNHLIAAERFAKKFEYKGKFYGQFFGDDMFWIILPTENEQYFEVT